MTRTPTFGIRLPTDVRPGRSSRVDVVALARSAEAAGFESAWLLDHLLGSPSMMGAASLEPLVTAAHVLGATTHLKVGTSILVAPLRNTVWLWKQLGSIAALAPGRLLAGVGAGWSEEEFALVAADRRRRGQTLSALVAAIMGARRGAVEDVGTELAKVHPAPRELGALYVGGGSRQLADGVEPARMTETVAARIASSDGWVVRASADPDEIRADLAAITAARARDDAGEFVVTKSSYVCLVDDTAEADAWARQRAAFADSYGDAPPESWRDRQVLSGTTATVAAHVDALRAAGVDRIVFHPFGDCDEQVGRLAALVEERWR